MFNCECNVFEIKPCVDWPSFTLYFIRIDNFIKRFISNQNFFPLVYYLVKMSMCKFKPSDYFFSEINSFLAGCLQNNFTFTNLLWIVRGLTIISRISAIILGAENKIILRHSSCVCSSKLLLFLGFRWFNKFPFLLQHTYILDTLRCIWVKQTVLNLPLVLHLSSVHSLLSHLIH